MPDLLTFARLAWRNDRGGFLAMMMVFVAVGLDAVAVMRLPKLVRAILLRRRLRELMPLRRDPMFRLHLKARRMLQLRSFGEVRPLPAATGGTIKFRRSPPYD